MEVDDLLTNGDREYADKIADELLDVLGTHVRNLGAACVTVNNHAGAKRIVSALIRATINMTRRDEREACGVSEESHAG